jgi:hypothetical protein
VAVTPLINKIIVFNKGTWNGGIINKPSAGQFQVPAEIGAILT